jgi:acetyl-CoA carboxylase biotin carboxylase subunit
MFGSLLIANRGEIARRIARTARHMGMRTIAVYSEADANMPFVKEADEAVLLGDPPPKDSYANVERILEAAKKTGAEAIHPGYGFLSESVQLVEACQGAGVIFVGPPPEALSLMGHKVDARQTMIKAGVPVVPGSEGALISEDQAADLAEDMGYPVMLKAAAGGGGIGMYRCKKEKQLRSNFEDAKKKGEMFFGSAEVFLEKLIPNPRHIEVQILADGRGKVLHLYERECSIQRRHQKLLEEAPSPSIGPETRAAMCAAAIKAAEAVGYANAGTVEFIVDEAGNFYFIEMNTRLQVEHPITEMTLGLDIVEWQLRIAAGEPLTLNQDDLAPFGHAIEVRLCAEDPEKRFFPSPGNLDRIQWPSGDGIRVEAALEEAGPVLPFYDSMFAKIIAHAENREAAIEKLASALSSTQLEGVKTNIELHKKILEDEVFRGGRYNTEYVREHLGMKY